MLLRNFLAEDYYRDFTGRIQACSSNAETAGTGNYIEVFSFMDIDWMDLQKQLNRFLGEYIQVAQRIEFIGITGHGRVDVLALGFDSKFIEGYGLNFPIHLFQSSSISTCPWSLLPFVRKATYNIACVDRAIFCIKWVMLLK